ncbi:MAG: DUF488 domain-containing protein [Candidatus Methanospirareceae archaeon]
MAKIWTVGTSNRSLEEFLALLKLHNIEVIVDVRRFPVSKYEHFRADKLKTSLENTGILYHHAQELGGYRKGGYKEYMKSEDFIRGIIFVERLASKKRVAIMCAEKLFFKCHRRYIADALKRRGNEIVHIIDAKRSYEHKTLEDYAK